MKTEKDNKLALLDTAVLRVPPPHHQRIQEAHAHRSNIAIYITRDYIVRRMKNLAFIVIYHDE